MKLKLNLLLLILVASFSFVGCSRPKQETTSKINLNFGGAPSQKVGSLSECSGVCLRHVVVNVSGSGFPGIDLSIDVEDLQSGNLSLEVPSGGDRLFQVIAVYYDSSNSSMIFYYGDSIQSLSGGTKDISIDVKPLNQSSSEQGHISGRWLGNDALAKYPTGELRVMYRPPNGRPAMTIEKSAIIAGWFSAFSIQGLNFDYVVKTYLGETVVLFENMNYENLTTSQNIFKVRLPAHIDEGKPEQPVNYIYGFFGAPIHTSGKYVCYETAAETLGRFKKSDGVSTYDWEELVKTGGTTDFVNCGGDSSFPFQTNSAIKVLPKFLLNGKTTSGGFLGPFAGRIEGTSLSIFTMDSNSFSVAVVPGGAAIFDKAVLFSLPADKNEVFGDDRVPCEAFARGEHGASRRGEVALLPTGTIATGSHNISAADSGLPTALCPSYQGKVHNGGYFKRGHSNAWPSPTPVASEATGFEIQGPHKISAGLCHVYGIKLKDGSNYSAVSSVPKSISIGLSGVTGVVYTDSNCTSSGSTISVPANMGYQQFSVLTSGGGSSGSLSSTTNDFANTAVYLNFEYTSSPGGEFDIKFAHSFQWSPPVGECRPIEFFVVDSSGYPTNLAGDRLFAITTSHANLGVYANCNDANALAGHTILGGQYRAQLYIKTTGPVPANATITAVHSTLSDAVYFNVSPGLNYLTLNLKKNSQIVGSYQLLLNECYEVNISADQNNASSLPLNSQLISSNGQFYPASDCVSGGSPQASFTVNPAMMTPSGGPIYFKAYSSPASVMFDQNYNPLISAPQSNVSLNNANFQGLYPSGLVGWFKSSSLSGSWSDSASLLSPIAYYGPASTPDANLQPYGVNVLRFGGASDYTDTLSLPNLSDMTISIMVKPSSISLNQNILKFAHGGTYTYLRISTGGDLLMDSNPPVLNSAVSVGNWAVIHLRRQVSDASNSTWYMSVNNGAWNSTNLTDTDKGAAITGITLGTSSSFIGDMAEIVIHNSVLNASDVQNNYMLLRSIYPLTSLP